MNHIITSTDMNDPNTDLIGMLCSMMEDTKTAEVETIHHVKFNRDGGKLRVEGPDLPIPHEVMLAISQMKSKIIDKMQDGWKRIRNERRATSRV